MLAFAGLVTRVVGQRQHFAGLHVQHHNTAGFGLVLDDGVFERLKGKKLHLAVDAELQVAPIDRGNLLTHVFHHPPHAVFDDTARACAPPQGLIERQLDTLLTLVFHIGETDHMGGSLALRVLTLVFFALVNAFESKRHHVFAHGVVHLTAQPDKRLVFVLEFFVQLGHGEPQQLGKLHEFFWLAWHVFRNRPNAGHRNARRQHHPVAIQNAPPVGRQCQGAGKAHFTLFLKKIVVNDLDVGGAPHQTGKGHRYGRHNQFAAPHRCRASQQRAGGVHNAAAHGMRPDAAVAATRACAKSGADVAEVQLT